MEIIQWDHNTMSELLIMAVQERSFLLDHTSMSNSDTSLNINGWKEVATKLGLPESGNHVQHVMCK